MNGVRELRKSSKMCPLVINADSDATVDIGIASTSRAMRASIGNLCYAEQGAGPVLWQNRSPKGTEEIYRTESEHLPADDGGDGRYL